MKQWYGCCVDPVAMAARTMLSIHAAVMTARNLTCACNSFRPGLTQGVIARPVHAEPASHVPKIKVWLHPHVACRARMLCAHKLIRRSTDVSLGNLWGAALVTATRMTAAPFLVRLQASHGNAPSAKRSLKAPSSAAAPTNPADVVQKAANALAAERGVSGPMLVDHTSAGHPIYRVKSTKEPSTDLAFVTWSVEKGRVIKPNTLTKAKKWSVSSGTSDAAVPFTALRSIEVREAWLAICWLGAAVAAACIGPCLLLALALPPLRQLRGPLCPTQRCCHN